MVRAVVSLNFLATALSDKIHATNNSLIKTDGSWAWQAKTWPAPGGRSCQVAMTITTSQSASVMTILPGYTTNNARMQQLELAQ